MAFPAVDLQVPGSVAEGPASPAAEIQSRILSLTERAKEEPLNVRRGTLDEEFKEIDSLRVRTENEDIKAEQAARELASGTPIFEFIYKNRKCLGLALHVAAMRHNGLECVRWLLKNRADVQSECEYMSFNKPATVQAIHVAIQGGDIQVLQELINNGAQANAKAKRDGDVHFAPLHEAAYFRDASVADFLIANNADIGSQNLLGMTPLHVAAKMGSADVSQVLIRAAADLQKLDNEDRSPLKVAVEASLFPNRRLHMLARWCVDDIMMVAEHCPSATVEFMRTLHKEHRRSGPLEADGLRITCGERRVNGSWRQRGEESGRPRYEGKRSAKEQMVAHWSTDKGEWQIWDKSQRDARPLYRSAVDNMVLPDTGWTAVEGAEPVPQVTMELMMQHWVCIMAKSPEAGAQLLELLTVVPTEESTFHHPLPTQACVRELRCDYQLDKLWKCDTEHTAELEGNKATPQNRSPPDLDTSKDDVSRRPGALRSWRPRCSSWCGLRGRSRSTGVASSGLLDAGSWPQWHDRLVPSRRKHHTHKAGRDLKSIFLDLYEDLSSLEHGTMELSPVHIRMLQMPGVICLHVLQTLAETDYLDIFDTLAAQSILKYTWESIVNQYHTVKLIYRVIELCMLCCLIWIDPYSDDISTAVLWYWMCCYSFLFVCSIKDSITELFDVYGYVVTLGSPGLYFLTLQKYVDWGTIVLFNVFAINGIALAGGRPMLPHYLRIDITAGVALSRWIQLMFTFRPYSQVPIVGENFIPILHCFKEIGGMFIIVLFFFAGFAHAAVVLQDDTTQSVMAMVINAFRLLFMQDGNGIDAILDIGSATGIKFVTRVYLLVSVPVFCIVLLNLFIAVIGEAYSKAHRNAVGLQCQEKAKICLDCMLQPHWPLYFHEGARSQRLLRHPKLDTLVLMAITVLIWAGWLAISANQALTRHVSVNSNATEVEAVSEDAENKMFRLPGGAGFLLHPVCPSLLLLVAMLFGNSFLAQRPWTSREAQQRSYLWWCAPVTASRNSTQGSAEKEDMADRLAAIEKAVQELSRKIMSNLSGTLGPGSIPLDNNNSMNRGEAEDDTLHPGKVGRRTRGGGTLSNSELTIYK